MPHRSRGLHSTSPNAIQTRSVTWSYRRPIAEASRMSSTIAPERTIGEAAGTIAMYSSTSTATSTGSSHPRSPESRITASATSAIAER